ncbi:putative ORFan [Tupanvirus deep ocean]|uniref:ORFan n=2 Tax=Tupanvirus TaxID=2094720 RepID=A0AC62A763_9VIRU|nr:putative ORFan [Tupanvirus deep ocean]QKU33523.1 putative ORFan [Tupanvirus deep ocean]
MGVSVIVNDAIASNEHVVERISFDYTLSKINYDIIDFRHWGMKWFFNDLGNKYHRQFLRETNVTAECLIIGAKAIINDVADNLSMSLPDDPIEARTVLKGILAGNKKKLSSIIEILKKMHDEDEINKAWDFISELTLKKEDENENNLLHEKIQSLMDHVELAVFFYTAGKNGHGIEWSF